MIDNIIANNIVWLFDVYNSISSDCLDKKIPKHANVNKTKKRIIKIIITIYSTVTDFARFLGLSTSVFFLSATW